MTGKQTRGPGRHRDEKQQSALCCPSATGRAAVRAGAGAVGEAGALHVLHEVKGIGH